MRVKKVNTSLQKYIIQYLGPVNQKRLVIVGGGAAGFFCAANAARLCPQLEVIILERSSKVLQKVKVSGGGRCNVTHACNSIADMVRCYPRGEKFLKKAFHHFFTNDTIAWFQEKGVELKAEADGRMFPGTNSSQTIIDCLWQEVKKYSVKVRMNAVVESISFNDQKWMISYCDTADSSKDSLQVINADFTCIACGGFPKASQFEWLLKATGHTIQPPVPSLFSFNMPGHDICQLMGLSVPEVRVRIAGLSWVTTGPLLITHWGLSGPAVLKMSAFAARDLAAIDYSYRVIINWLPDFNENSLREKILQHRNLKGNQKLVNTDWIKLPQRLWEFLLKESGADLGHRWAELGAPIQNRLIKTLCGMELPAKGKTTFKEEFVTAGGIELSQINPATMQSRLQPNLFFAGEIMDVDGITGGYNFQHAWTSGYVAANAIANQHNLL